MTARDAAAAVFAELTGSAPAAVFSAPGRVNLIGEHTDYNDGFVLPFAIDRRTYASVGMRDDDVVRVVTTDDAGDSRAASPSRGAHLPLSALAAPTFPRDAVPEWAAYPLGVAWALLRATGARPRHGVDIAIASDVPIGAGLSSSAAIEGAAASALDDVWALGLDAQALARVGRAAENEAVGAPTGIMDQMASMLGRAGAALFLDCRSLDTTLVDLGLAEAELEIVVIDTRVTHAHSTGGYGDRRAACERAAAAMAVPSLRELTEADLPALAARVDDETSRRARHVVTENQRVLDTVRTLRTEGPRAIGPLLTASHASLRDDFEVSTPELDTAVDAALAAGALGARMTGGGFGGAAIALVPTEHVEQVRDAVTAAFEASAFTAPHVFPAIPSAGAHRE
ncbi:MAG: galactokinase [Microbacterium sp.]|uniref:galactokinase n=1 Tax=Microbacterium sp. TaxID=51671 RepID=UPI003A83A8F6